MRLLNRILNIALYVGVVLTINPAFAAEQRVGVVGAANDTLSAVGNDGGERTLSLGDDIFFKEVIKTDDTGNAQLLFVDRSALTVGANASVVIDEFVYNPATSGGNMVMRGTKGTFRFIGGALSKKNAVKIETPVGTIGIRGGIALVQINPVSGATNATFVYGDQMTFANMAGDIQTVNSTGAGIAVNTPNAMPAVFQMSAQQMSVQVSNLSGKVGTSAGAAVVPTEDDVSGNLTTDAMQGPEGGSEPTAVDMQQQHNNDQGDSQGTHDGGHVDSHEGDSVGAEGDHSDNRGPEGEGNHRGPEGDGGHMTADGGYVDGEGKYHSPEEVAAYMAENPDGGDENGPRYGQDRSARFGEGTHGGEEGGDQSDGGGYFGRFFGGEEGGEEGHQGGDHMAAGGHEGDGGHMTADGGYVDGEGKYHSPEEVAAYMAENPDDGPRGAGATDTAGQGGPRDPGQLTADGGYIDSEGNYHSAGELAAYRAGQMGDDSSGSNGGGYYGDQTGGDHSGDRGGYRGDSTSGGHYGDGGGYQGDSASGGHYGDGGGYQGDSASGGHYGDGGGYQGDSASGGHYGDGGGYQGDSASGGNYGDGGGYQGDSASGRGFYRNYFGGDDGGNTGGNSGGARDPGQLTADGGYIDSEGNHHSAGELAAYRAGRMGDNGGDGGGYYGDTTSGGTHYGDGGGYYGDPAAGGANHGDGGGYYGNSASGGMNHGDGGGYYGDSAGGGMNHGDGGGYYGDSAGGGMHRGDGGGYYGDSAGGGMNRGDGGGYYGDSAGGGMNHGDGGGYYGDSAGGGMHYGDGGGYYGDSAGGGMHHGDGGGYYGDSAGGGMYHGDGGGYYGDSAGGGMHYGDGGGYYGDSAGGGMHYGDGGGYHGDPAAGGMHYGDPAAMGAVMDPNTGIFYDPNTGGSFDPATNTFYDPNGAVVNNPDVFVPPVNENNNNTPPPAPILPQGYMAGVYTKDSQGTPENKRYWNTNRMTYTLGADNKYAGAQVSVNSLDGGGNLDVRFGNYATGSDLGSQAVSYTDEKNYSIGHAGITNGKTISSITGALKAGSYNPLNGQLTCNACQYVHWGIWDTTVHTTGPNTVDIASSIPFVSGQMTPTLPQTLNAIYSGGAYGTTVNGQTVAAVNGTFTAGINISGGVPSLTSFSTNIAGPNMTLTNSGSWSGSSFSGASIGGSGYTGQVNGALFGPAAENIGGNMNFSNGTVDGTAVYMGSK